MSKKAYALLVFIWLSFMGLMAAAQESGRVGIEEEIIVISRGLEETIPLDLEQFGNRVEVITAEELELGGFNDLSQSLQMKIPGLYLAAKNGAFDYVNCSLQGSRCQDILWLIDGIRINNRLYNSTSPLDTVPAHMVERIEVLYGGQGIFYGTQSVAGVVNVVTKAFSRQPSGNVALSVDSNDGVHVNAGYQTAVEGHEIVFYFSKDEAEGFQPFKDEHYQPSGSDRNRGYDVRTGGIKYAYSFSDSSKLTLHYHHTDNEVDWASPSNRAQSFNERDEDLVMANWDYAINENVDLFLKTYYHDWDSWWTRRDNQLDASGNLTGNINVKSNQEYWGYKDYGLTSMVRVRRDHGLEYAFGYDHQRFSGRDDVLLIADKTESVNAVFGQIKTSETLLEKTRLAVGVRYNRPSGQGDITVGNISAQHHFSDNLYLRSSLGTSFRLPDAWQLYGNDPCCTQGNPDLEGEKGRNFNLALGGSATIAEAFAWEVIVFKRQIDNLIGSANGVQINTENTVDFDGWEVSLALSFNADWELDFDYVNTEAKAKGSSNQIADIPENTMKLGLLYRPSDAPYEISASIVNIGDIYDSVSGGIGRLEHGGYSVVDISGAYYWGSNQRHRAGFRLENALDKQYASSLGRAFTDSSGGSYAYENLGTPRTLHLAYNRRF